MDGQTLGIILGSIGIGVTLVLGVPALWMSRRGKQDNERLERVEKQLEELLETSAAPPPGSAHSETTALAAQATDKTERLLAEAVVLQDEHKEREAIEKLLTAYDMEMPPEAKTQLHLLVGNSFFKLDELDEAEGHYRQALTASRMGGIEAGKGIALGLLGIVYGEQEEFQKAREHLEQAVAVHRSTSNGLGEARDLFNLGVVFERQTQFDQAKTRYQQSLDIDHDLGNHAGETATLDRLANILGKEGLICTAQGDFTHAREYHQQSLDIKRQIGDRTGQAIALANLGLVTERLGEREEACVLLGQSAAIYAEAGVEGEGPDKVRGMLEELGCEEET